LLPKPEQDENDTRQEYFPQAYQDLEVHILYQANQVGLVLVVTIRLHRVLKTLPSTKPEAWIIILSTTLILGTIGRNACGVDSDKHLLLW
jgi:hypothetical protein